MRSLIGAVYGPAMMAQAASERVTASRHKLLRHKTLSYLPLSIPYSPTCISLLDSQILEDKQVGGSAKPYPLIPRLQHKHGK